MLPNTININNFKFNFISSYFQLYLQDLRGAKQFVDLGSHLGFVCIWLGMKKWEDRKYFNFLSLDLVRR